MESSANLKDNKQLNKFSSQAVQKQNEPADNVSAATSTK